MADSDKKVPTCGFSYETGQPAYSPFCSNAVPYAAVVAEEDKEKPAPVELYRGECPPGSEMEACKDKESS